MIYGSQQFQGSPQEIVDEFSSLAAALGGGTDDQHEKTVLEHHVDAAQDLLIGLVSEYDGDVYVDVSGAIGEDGNRLTVTVALV